MNYEVNEGTLAIIAAGSSKSRVLEDNKEYLVDNTPFEIIDHSCKYFGSSYEGRKAGSKEILNIEYKVPIVIESSKNIIFFPTLSPTSIDCCWICLKQIKAIKEIDDYGTEIIFNNEQRVILPVSKRMIENQVFRASRLDLILRNRKI